MQEYSLGSLKQDKTICILSICDSGSQKVQNVFDSFKYYLRAVKHYQSI